MSTQTTKMNLVKPSVDEAVDVTVINGNMDIIDAHTHAAADIASGTVNVARLPTVTVAKGGTGKTSLTSGSYMVGNGTSAVSLKTPAQVRTDIGAASQADMTAVQDSISRKRVNLADGVVLNYSGKAAVVSAWPYAVPQEQAGQWITVATIDSALKPATAVKAENSQGAIEIYAGGDVRIRRETAGNVYASVSYIIAQGSISKIGFDEVVSRVRMSNSSVFPGFRSIIRMKFSDDSEYALYFGPSGIMCRDMVSETILWKFTP